MPWFKNPCQLLAVLIASGMLFANSALGAPNLLVQQVADINAGSANSSPAGFGEWNNTLFFRATDSAHGSELWQLSGAGGGPQLLADITPGSASSIPITFVPFQNQLYFRVNTGTSDDFSIWRYNGTSVSQVLYPNAGATPNYLADMTAYNNKLYFSLRQPSTGIELWSYDGTNLAKAAEINPDATDSFFVSYGSSWPSHFKVFNSQLYFQATDGASGTGFEPWRFDGTTASTVADVNPVGSSTSNAAGYDFTIFNGALYFKANDGSHGAELWRYDGSTTSMVADINSGSGGSDPNYLTVSGNRLYFAANDGIHGSELWYYDGVSTNLAADINVGSASSNIASLAAMGNLVFFSAIDKTITGGQGGGQIPDPNGTGTELWVFDGTSASEVADINPGSGSSSPANLYAFNNQVYFSANDGTTGQELWSVQVVPEPVSTLWLLMGTSLLIRRRWR